MVHGRQAAHAGQPHVEHDGVGPSRGGRLQPLFGRRRRVGTVAKRLGQLGQSPADTRFVVDDQQMGHKAVYLP